MLLLLEQGARGREELVIAGVWLKSFGSRSCLYVTHTAILFGGGEKKHFGPITQAIVGVHSYETRWRGRGGGGRRRKVSRQSSIANMAFMPDESRTSIGGSF